MSSFFEKSVNSIMNVYVFAVLLAAMFVFDQPLLVTALPVETTFNTVTTMSTTTGTSSTKKSTSTSKGPHLNSVNVHEAVDNSLLGAKARQNDASTTSTTAAPNTPASSTSTTRPNPPTSTSTTTTTSTSAPVIVKVSASRAMAASRSAGKGSKEKFKALCKSLSRRGRPLLPGCGGSSSLSGWM